MEQHNIDSRFKEGLNNLERKPSADAWARLQSQLNTAETAPETAMPAAEEKEEKKVIWWYYVAAALTLLLVSVAVFRNNNMLSENGNKSQLAVNSPVTKQEADQKKDKQVLAPKVENTASTAVAITNSEKEKAATIIERTPVPHAVISKKTVAFSPKKPEIKTGKIKTETTPKVSEGTLPTETPQLAKNTEPAPKESMQEATKPEMLAGAIEVIVKKDNLQNAVAATSETASEPGRKTFKIKNVFRQALSLKNGDGIDLKELGLTPNSKLAMETKNIQQKFSKILDSRSL